MNGTNFISLSEALAGQFNGAAEALGTFSASELGSMTFPPIKYAVPGLIPEGCSILAGRPKLGKSWLALNHGLATASGGRAFSAAQCEPGDVLALALEDAPPTDAGADDAKAPPLWSTEQPSQGIQTS